MDKAIKFITILCALVMVSTIIVGCHHKNEEAEKRETKKPDKIVEAEKLKLDEEKEPDKIVEAGKPDEEKKPEEKKKPDEEKKPNVEKKPNEARKPNTARKPDSARPDSARINGENLPTPYLILAPPSQAGTEKCDALNIWVEKIDSTMTKIEEEIQKQEDEIFLLEEKQKTLTNLTLFREDNKKILLEHIKKSIEDKKIYAARLVDNMEVLRKQFIHTSHLYVTSCIY